MRTPVADSRRWHGATGSIVWLLLALFSSPSSTEEQVAVESYRTLSPAAVKDMQARADSLNLHEDAALLAYRLLGTAGSRILITLDPPQAESAKAVTVTVIRDGFLDDSVRGDWHRFFLHRDGGAWEITDIQQAFRCRRGASTNSFNQGLCP